MSTENFNLHRDIEGRAVLTFDQPGSSANILTEEALRELDDHLQELKDQPDLSGLIICSAKPTIFIAGADLKQLSAISEGALHELIELGQSVFERLAALPVPTVAAIHGACAGGGLELALACDWRVASDSRTTKIGLPETNLGIIPAWGGTTRLPRLIGLPRALGVILTGKLMCARTARHRGLVDAIAPKECLLAEATRLLADGKRSAPRWSFLHCRPAVAYIRRRTRTKILQKSRGLYPAPLTALQVACRGVRSSVAKSLRREREAIMDLAARPETRQLIRLFFLTERARKTRPGQPRPEAIPQVAVVGAGVMGSGIAYWLSTRGVQVVLQDISDEALAKAMQRLEALYDRAVASRMLTRHERDRGWDRIVPVSKPVPLTHTKLVIEAATEDLPIKRRIFADLASRAGTETIFATNTSALPLQKLARNFPHPDRLVGMHFFNPVHRMRLVEIVRGEHTSGSALSIASSFVQQIGKLPVVVGDQPGFLVNRILMPYLMEAVDLFVRGGDPVAIDRAMLDFGMPMGPLRLLDEVGLDVAAHVAGTLSQAFPERMRTPPLIARMTDQGMLGRKSGAGFYLYDQRGPRPNPQALWMQTGTIGLPDDLGENLAQIMIQESLACLRDGVTTSEDELDLAMVLGTGFAPFRGGPLAYARSLSRKQTDSRSRSHKQLHPNPIG